jgi:hypothetical protein
MPLFGHPEMFLWSASDALVVDAHRWLAFQRLYRTGFSLLPGFRPLCMPPSHMELVLHLLGTHPVSFAVSLPS